MGTEGAITFLSLVVDKRDRIEKISTFISMSAANYIGVDIEDLFSEGKSCEVVTKCRMICYKLHKDFLDMSIRRAGKVYGKTENTVMKSIRRMEDVMQDARRDQQLFEDYLKVRNTVRIFIKHIEEDIYGEKNK